IRCTLFAESSLRPYITATDGPGPGGGSLRCGRPGFRDILRQNGGFDRHALAEVRPRGQEICDDHDRVYGWETPLCSPDRITGRASCEPDRRRTGVRRYGFRLAAARDAPRIGSRRT